MWVKGTDLDGNGVWLNMLQARLVVPGEDGGSSVIFGQDDALDVREDPEQLVRGEPRWPTNPEGVGFIPRSQPEVTKNDATDFETALTRLMDAQRKRLRTAHLEDHRGHTIVGPGRG